MLFNSLQFLAFLPVVFAIYWGLLARKETRLAFLLAASYFFYMSWNPKLIILLWLSTLIDYYAVVGMRLTSRPETRRALLGASLVFNLGMLSLFKYANFFLADVAGPLSGWRPPHLDIILPLGISFYTFETLSYTIDCFYGITEPFENLRDYAFFISFFPHLIAGPIIRPRQFLPQIQKMRDLSREDLATGFSYFFMGMLKKVVVADHLSRYADQVFSNPAPHGSLTTWAAVVAYAMQIYCDFSGYTDMAIGLARLFAFRLPVNFRTPYLSRNVAEFWKRWHISLSSWLRDYLYAPIRRLWEGDWNNYFAVFATMFLGGLWHGASWTFVAWGAYHGALLMAHRLAHQKFGDLWRPAAALLPAPVREVVSRVFVFFLICIGWTFFRAQTFATAFHMIGKMLIFRPEANPFLPGYVLPLIGLVLAYDLAAYTAERKDADVEAAVAASPALLRAGGYALAIFLLLAFAPSDNRPFIYFQF